MAVMEALLKIKASVDGEGAVTALAKGMGGLKKGAENASSGLGGMLKSAGGLSGALGSLVPLVSGVGLAAMAKGAIDAADNLNDLSQKTGVSVERLSQFDQAAKASGTTLESVSKSMIKLGKGLAESDSGPAAKALKELGVSATDASGKLKSTDELVLQVSDKFKAMPDGAEKSALAIQLFGKSGADMIPLLNGGRKAVESLGITMTTKFAKGADDANDKLVVLQTKLVELSVKLGTALMPALNTITDLVIRMATGFSSLPDWMQGTIAAVGGLVIALGPLVQILSGAMVVIKGIAALKLGATIAGWAGALGPAMGVISAAFSGLLAFLSGTVLPALLAFFSGPVGWTVLAVAAVAAMAIAFRKPLGQFITWLGSVFKKGWDGFVDNILEKPVKAYFKWWRSNWESAVKFVTGLFSGIAKALKAPLDGIVSILKNTLRLAFRNLENAFNAFVLRYNNLVANLKKSPFGGILGLIPTIPLLNIPKFAQGGLVTKPTIAMVGEGGQNEFILPESKLQDFAQFQADKALQKLLDSAFMRSILQPTKYNKEAFLQLEKQLTDLGLTGSNDLGSAKPVSPLTGATGTTEKPVLNVTNTFSVDPVIQITTGPVIQFESQRFVTVETFQDGLQTVTRTIFQSLRNPATRVQLAL